MPPVTKIETLPKVGTSKTTPHNGWTSRTVYHRQGRSIGCVVIDTPRKALALTVSGLLHLEERLD